MATVTTPIATDATLSSGLTAIKNAIADTRGTTSMQCDNSDSWSSSTTYAVGKTVIYDNKVWECLVQNNGQTPSGTSTYWKQVTLSSLNSSLTNTVELITTINAPIEQTVYNFATSIFNYREVIFEVFFGGIRYSQIQLNTKYIKDFRTGNEANIISLPPYIHSVGYYVEFTFCVLSGTQIKTRDIHTSGWTDLTTFKIYGIK